jgi:CRP/FNR family cyclic AMP-dependent transcriptional regulator
MTGRSVLWPLSKIGSKRRFEAQTLHQSRDCFLSMDIFRDLEPEAMQAFEESTELRTCRKGQLLYSQQDRAEVLFLLKRGRVQLYRLTPAGKRLELATIRPGTFFGEMPSIGCSLRQTFAEALEDSLICIMSRADIEGLMLAKPRVALRMIEQLSQRLALYQARLEEMAYGSVPARIAAVLLRLSRENSYKGEQAILITHQELGEMVGALRESVTKVLDEFQRMGLVELRRGSIRVCKGEELERLLQE